MKVFSICFTDLYKLLIVENMGEYSTEKALLVQKSKSKTALSRNVLLQCRSPHQQSEQEGPVQHWAVSCDGGRRLGSTVSRLRYSPSPRFLRIRTILRSLPKDPLEQALNELINI